MLESNGQHRKAFTVLVDALKTMDSHDPETIGLSGDLDIDGKKSTDSEKSGPVYQFTPSDRTRSLALTQKLGSSALYISSISNSQSKGYQEYDLLSEKYLTRALMGIIALTNPNAGPGNKDGTKLVGRDFGFPSSEDDEGKGGVMDVEGIVRAGSVSKKGLGMIMESLGDLYARRGDHE